MYYASSNFSKWSDCFVALCSVWLGVDGKYWIKRKLLSDPQLFSALFIPIVCRFSSWWSLLGHILRVEGCSWTINTVPEGLCVLSVWEINLCRLVHNGGCQLPEGPYCPLPVIRLSLINPLMQNVQYQFFFPLCNLDKLGELDEGDAVDAFSVKQGDRWVHAVVSLT